MTGAAPGADRQDDDGRARALPVDPALSRFPAAPEPRGALHFVCVDTDSGRVEATAAAGDPVTRGGRMAAGALRAVLGAPLRSTAVAHERMRKLVALPVLSADALSSVAYGPEAMLAVLVLGGSAALVFALPIAAVIAVMMLAVGASYRQTIRAYPHGGGSYVVASANLGRRAGLVAAGGLIVDYVITVAISIASGLAAVTSAVPALGARVVPLGAAVIALLVAANLRGVRQAGAIFAAPTYAFVVGLAALVAVGLAQTVAGWPAPLPSPPPAPRATEAAGLLLVLRAFASGSTAMTGIETISNAVPAFQPPQARNARTTLTVMVGLLIALFAGTIALVEAEGVVPRTGETVLSQLAHHSFGAGPLYVYIQAATAAVLLLAANTAFNGFPRLLFIMARERHAPRLFLHVGDRLAYSNGIVALGVAAGVVFCASGGSTTRLISLYAVGVFLAFTLCQAGMVVHWWRERGVRWRTSLVCNGLGGTLSGLVFVVGAATKFTSGAWAALAGVAAIAIGAERIRRHYDAVRRAVAAPAAARLRPARPALDGAGSGGSADEAGHLTVVPVASLDLVSLRALAYAQSLRRPVLAVHVCTAEGDADRFVASWRARGDPVPLEVVVSPYRAIVVPLLRYVEDLHRQRPDLTFTVVLGELVLEKPLHRLLHDDLEPRVRRGLRRQRDVVVTTVPFAVRERPGGG